MDLPSTADALRIMRDARARVDQLVRGLTDEQLEAPSTVGDWSVKDLIGHLASWEELALGWLQTAKPPDRPLPGTDELNAHNVDAKRVWPLAQLRERSSATHEMLLEAIERTDDERWATEVDVPGRGRAALGMVVGYVLAGDEHGLYAHDLAHLPDLERYVGSLR